MRAMIKQKEASIEELKNECKDLEQERDRYKKRLEKYIIYQDYLERVLELSDEFSELREVMARYDTLIATHSDLMSREQKNQEIMEREKHKFHKFMEDKNTEILHCNNQLAQLQTRLDKAQSEAVHWESKWTHIQNTAAKKTLLLGRIKIATHNLYQLVARHAKHNQDGENEKAEKSKDDKQPRKASANLAAAGSTEQTAMQL